MKCCTYTLLSSFLLSQILVPVLLQSIQGRHYRPLPNKCDRFGRCSAKDGYIEEALHDDEYKSDKERPAELSRDDWPVRPADPEAVKDDKAESGKEGVGYHPQPPSKRDDEVQPARPTGGGGGYGGGGYNPKLAVDRGDDVKAARPISGYDPKPVVTVDPKPARPSGGGSYNPKPVIDRDEDLKPARPTGGGSYPPKPAVDRDDDRKPVRPSDGGGYNPKPVIDRNDDLKPVRPSGGYHPKPAVGRDDLKPARPSGGGIYNPKPVVDRDDDLKPVRPSGGYHPKPAVDRDDDLKPARPSGGGGGYGGGYNPKPVDREIKPVRGRPGEDYGGYDRNINRDEDHKVGAGRPSSGGGGGGYKPKPARDRDATRPSRPEYKPKPIDDDYEIKPARGGGGYYPDSTRKPIREDLGGYDKPKDDDYNDDYKHDDKDYDYDDGNKPIPVVDGNCICVPYYQCTEGHIVTDGAGIIDARKRPQPDDELPLDGKFRPPSCGPFHVCCNAPETSTVKPYEHRCGVRNPSGINSRILSPSNKGEADFGEWPWQAAVLKAEGKVNIFQCGGVLIDKYHVVTVAHCVFHLYQYNEYPLKVRLGEWDTQSTTEFLAHEDYRVSKIIVHPEYRNTSLWNDVAILRLQDPVLFAPHIDTVCLPQYDELFDGQNCVVTGWGKDAYKGGTFSNVMKEVALQVIDNYKCEEMLRKTRLGRFFQLHQGFLCAGGEYGLDSCKGDGGGPLVCYRKDKSYALAGIVSWGIDCGQPGVPGVYVKMQKYLDWISKTTGVSLQDYWPKT